MKCVEHSPCLAAGDQALQTGTDVTLAGGNFEVAVDDANHNVSMCDTVIIEKWKEERDVLDLRYGKQDTSTTAQSTQKVGSNRESSNAGTTEGGSSGDNTLQLLVHALLTVTGHNEALVLQLLGNIAGSRAGDLDPGLGEESAGNKHESNVDSSVDRVKESLLEVQRGRHVISNTRGSEELGRTLTGLPDSEKLDKDVVREARVQHLRDQEDVGGQSRLEHDRHVGGVEQTDRVRAAHATLTGGLDGDLNAEALQVDDSGENEKSGQKVHDVGEVLTVEGLVQSTLLVVPGEEQVEEGNDSTLELGATASVDGSGGKGLPDDGLANVGSDEQGNTTAQTVALLQQLIQQNNDQTGNNQLDNEQNTDTSTQVARLTIETSQDVHTGLTEGQDDGEQLLGGLVELAVGLEVKVDVDEVGTGKELKGKKGELQLLLDISHIEMISHTWKTMPEEMIGVIPNSIRVPRLLANIIRSQYRGSEVSEETIPYKGI